MNFNFDKIPDLFVYLTHVFGCKHKNVQQLEELATLVVGITNDNQFKGIFFGNNAGQMRVLTYKSMDEVKSSYNMMMNEPDIVPMSVEELKAYADKYFGNVIYDAETKFVL